MLRDERRELNLLQEDLFEVLKKYNRVILTRDTLDKIKNDTFSVAFNFVSRLGKNLSVLVEQGDSSKWDYILELSDLVNYPIFIYCHIRNSHLDICLRIWD